MVYQATVVFTKEGEEIVMRNFEGTPEEVSQKFFQAVAEFWEKGYELSAMHTQRKYE